MVAPAIKHNIAVEETRLQGQGRGVSALVRKEQFERRLTENAYRFKTILVNIPLFTLLLDFVAAKDAVSDVPRHDNNLWTKHRQCFSHPSLKVHATLWCHGAKVQIGDLDKPQGWRSVVVWRLQRAIMPRFVACVHEHEYQTGHRNTEEQNSHNSGCAWLIRSSCHNWGFWGGYYFVHAAFGG